MRKLLSEIWWGGYIFYASGKAIQKGARVAKKNPAKWQ